MQMEVCDRQSAVGLPEEAIRHVVEIALAQEGRDAELSIALVDDDEIVRLNRRFLGRDGATDVLAFAYESDEQALSGEIVVNAEMAVRQAAGRPHSAADELLLYIVHGLLHLLGYDDHEAEDTRRMREREQEVLAASGRHVEF